MMGFPDEGNRAAKEAFMWAIRINLLVIGLFVLGCNSLSSDGAGDWLGPGDDCSNGEQCSEGLVCSGTEGVCTPVGAPGTTSVDGPCNASWECQYGLSCASSPSCRA